MNCSSSVSDPPGVLKRTGVDATLRDGAQMSAGVTGRNVAGVSDGSTDTFHVMVPSATLVHPLIAGANVVASGNHSPTTPLGKSIFTWASILSFDQK